MCMERSYNRLKYKNLIVRLAYIKKWLLYKQYFFVQFEGNLLSRIGLIQTVVVFIEIPLDSAT